MFLRKLLDRFEHHFKKGGRLEKLYPLYEANDTFLFTPGEVAGGRTHVRDAIDTKRMMSMVIVAFCPKTCPPHSESPAVKSQDSMDTVPFSTRTAPP